MCIKIRLYKKTLLAAENIRSIGWSVAFSYEKFSSEDLVDYNDQGDRQDQGGLGDWDSGSDDNWV
jgi:hypothetical protein